MPNVSETFITIVKPSNIIAETNDRKVTFLVAEGTIQGRLF